MAEQVSTLLTRVKETLSDPTKWTKEAFAKNEFGGGVGVTSNKATCFCLQGALTREGYRLGYSAHVRHLATEAVMRSIRKLYPHYGHDSIPPFNDAHATTHGDILRVINQAIEETNERRETSPDGNAAIAQ